MSKIEMATENPEEEEKVEVPEEPQLKTRPDVFLAFLQIETDDVSTLENFYTIVCIPILQYLNEHTEMHNIDPQIWLILSFVKNVIDERREFVTGENGLSANCSTTEDLQGPIGKWPDMIPKLLHSILLYIHHYYLYRETFLRLCEKFQDFAHFIEEKEKEFKSSLLKNMQSIIQYPQNLLSWVNQLYDKTEKKEKVSQDETKLTKTINFIKATIQRCQAATTDGIPDEITAQSIVYKLTLTGKTSTYGRFVNVDYSILIKQGTEKDPPVYKDFRLKGKVISKISPHCQENHEQISCEIEANKRLHHRNVLKMEKYLEDELFHYLLFPDTEKWELSDVMAKSKALSEEAARPIFRELMHGVQHMHSNGVIHGQLSQNAIVFYKDHVRISDFSLCHLAMPGDQKATKSGPLLYMSPESFKTPFDGSANDVWSCGILLYEMLAGYNPFKKRGGTNAGSTSTLARRANKTKTIT
ncbi:CAMK family protein kinase [Tritrichomonas foetus]|uniref:CAMK family protein kinase n=1 Tax=Tritrichomonas foetus TaxID=1144522 RepID=A0A1J4JX43_9EUKA|nr:CAMK family protein kinase [Tritrichomonas foetus]|eukprot:OHT03719.1 CAMK family protein kinase [Tritrichomonas foetus]